MQGILGQDILDNWAELPELPQRLFDIMDPEGIEVVRESERIGDDYLCEILFKVRDTILPLEQYVLMPSDLFQRIVHNIDLSALQEVH